MRVEHSTTETKHSHFASRPRIMFDHVLKANELSVTPRLDRIRRNCSPIKSSDYHMFSLYCEHRGLPSVQAYVFQKAKHKQMISCNKKPAIMAKTSVKLRLSPHKAENARVMCNRTAVAFEDGEGEAISLPPDSHEASFALSASESTKRPKRMR